MNNYIDFKNELEGFNNIADTIKTVQKVSVSSIYTYKKKIISLQQYLDEVQDLMNKIYPFIHKKLGFNKLESNKNIKKGILILTSDKGLVGGIWHNMINTFIKDYKNYHWISVWGNKGKRYLEEENIFVDRVWKYNQYFSFDDIAQLWQELKILYAQEVFNHLDILFLNPVSLIVQRPKYVQFLPFKYNEQLFNSSVKLVNRKVLSEPSLTFIYEKISEKYFLAYLYKIFLDSEIAEFSARTISTENDSVKIKEMVFKLQLNYFKERRRILTQRQLESFIVHKII